MIKLTITINNNPTKSYLIPTINHTPLPTLVYQHPLFCLIFYFLCNLTSRILGPYSSLYVDFNLGDLELTVDNYQFGH